jgi:hypothetical protein
MARRAAVRLRPLARAVALAAAAALLAACSGDSRGADGIPRSAPTIQGQIIAFSGDWFRVIESAADPAAASMRVEMGDSTRIIRRGDTTSTRPRIDVRQRVSVWIEGARRGEKPPEGVARVIVIEADSL